MASYDVKLTGKDIIYFFFKKKKCPICGEKMKREKKVKSLGKEFDGVKVGKSYYYGGHYEVTLLYKCSKCDKLFSIDELSGETKKH
ncbi:MAG TPA: hypothetical protein VF941_15235 [Clostridia bacterium]